MSLPGPPRHRIIVLPWIRVLAQRLIMPNWLAITIGPLIFAWRALDSVELAHELAHVVQWRKNGPLYILVISGPRAGRRRRVVIATGTTSSRSRPAPPRTSPARCSPSTSKGERASS